MFKHDIKDGKVTFEFSMNIDELKNAPWFFDIDPINELTEIFKMEMIYLLHKAREDKHWQLHFDQAEWINQDKKEYILWKEERNKIKYNAHKIKDEK